MGLRELYRELENCSNRRTHILERCSVEKFQCKDNNLEDIHIFDMRKQCNLLKTWENAVGIISSDMIHVVTNKLSKHSLETTIFHIRYAWLSSKKNAKRNKWQEKLTRAFVLPYAHKAFRGKERTSPRRTFPKKIQTREFEREPWRRDKGSLYLEAPLYIFLLYPQG